MKLFLAVILALSGVVHAAQLSTSNGVEFLVINGKSINKYPEGAANALELVPGKYQIVARFEDNLKRGSKNTLFTSTPYVFDITIDQSDLVLLVPRMRTQSQAAAFFRDPAWQLKEVSTQIEQPVIPQELVGTGFGAFRNMEKAVAHHNQKNGIVFDDGNVKDLEELLITQEKKDLLVHKGDAGAQLKWWYTQANVEEKKAFRRWIISQDF